MWLWKKFWNTDIIGKIYILIILFIIVVATITVVTRYKNATIKTTNDTSVNEEIYQENIIIEQDENNGEQLIPGNEIKEDEDVQKEEVSKEVLNPIKETEEKKEIATVNKKVEEKLPETSSKTETKEDKPIQEDTKEEVKKVEQNNEEKTEVKAENNNQDVEKKEESKIQANVEEYKENTEMINRMKTFIENNPSQDMTTYGFNVVVDSSIVNSTNQFTYSDQRMKNFLALRFGTIRIYAQDYYYNGNLVMTECFIF